MRKKFLKSIMMVAMVMMLADTIHVWADTMSVTEQIESYNNDDISDIKKK